TTDLKRIDTERQDFTVQQRTARDWLEQETTRRRGGVALPVVRGGVAVSSAAGGGEQCSAAFRGAGWAEPVRAPRTGQPRERNGTLGFPS
ncbi:hypothetical protein AB0957_34105, partial [Streptomyces zhihengii]|uniref:hypothetical protein n=1 Tax=Streptomyces zhihengii TaxID=1818004 RepID=UPI003453DAD0